MDNYWENRYKSGGDSGAGSYGEYAKHKAEIINDYINKYNIKTISDFGCGDGNQISLFTGYENYMGYDISSYALYLCHEKFKDNKKMSFCSLISDLPEADLCLSLDVLYHIIDEKEYEEYLSLLFSKSKKHVLIFSSNHTDNKHLLGKTTCPIFHRKITEWIGEKHDNFILVEEVENFLLTTAKFFLYERKS
jgi:SAM-dependent methyltransferase